MYKSSRCFLPSFESTAFLVQEKKRKIDNQGGSHGSHLGFPIETILGFPIETILAIFGLQNTPMLPNKFQVNWLPWSLAIFNLNVTPTLPTESQVNLSFDSGEKAENKFSRWPPHLRFPIETILAIFDLQVTPMLPNKF